MKFLIDMNMSPRWRSFFAIHDIESVHWSEIGECDASDSMIFAYAAQNKMVILSKDLDFGFLLSSSNDRSPSVILIRAADSRPESIGDSLLSAINSFKDELETGALVTIMEEKHRVRILPFRNVENLLSTNEDRITEETGSIEKE